MKQELRTGYNLLTISFSAPFMLVLTTVFILAFSRFAAAQEHQVYGNVGIGVNMFHTSDIENMKTKFPPFFSLGFGFYQSEDQKTDLTFELTLSNRVYERSYDSQDFSYVFFAPEGMVLVGRNIYEKVYAQLGAGLSYVVPLGVWPNPFARLAGDFSPVDVLISGGGEYAFSPAFAGGVSFRMGLINMLEYTPIDNYGDFGESVRDIRYRNLQIYLRYYVNKRAK
ncbi:MAG TPA: hypothetical protein VJ911_08075 [Cryomorphaceae bacterium]|nr:hypothetical protein [Cryomorphaceae bacterium]